MHAVAERTLNHTRTHVRVLARVRRRRGLITALEEKQWQDRDNGQYMCLRYSFMNVGELSEERQYKNRQG